LTKTGDFDTVASLLSCLSSFHLNNLTLNFWKIYEMGFPEGSHMKAPRGIITGRVLEAHLFG